MAEQDFQEFASQGPLGELLAAMGEAVVVIDEDNRIVLFNGAAEELFGYKSGDIEGKQLEILLPESSRKVH